MRNGVTISGFGAFPQTSRRDLGTPRLQNALAKVHGRRPSAISCLCRVHENVFLPMEVYATGNAALPYRVDRRRVSDAHDSNCIYVFENDDIRQLVAAPSSKILHAEGVHPKRAMTNHDVQETDDRDGGPRHVDFSGFASRAFGLGYTKAWSRSNLFTWPRCLPSTGEILRSIYQSFSGQEFKDAQNVFAAASLLGAEFVCGVWSETLSLNPMQSKRVVRALRTDDRGQLMRCYFSVEDKIEVSAAQQAQIFDHVVTPPYFFTAVVTPASEILKLFIRPVLFTPETLHAVDSDLERRVGLQFMKEGRTYYKPPGTMEFYEQLPSEQQLLPGVIWRYEPDFLFYEAKPSGKVIEVCGFDTTHVNYHTQLMVKWSYYTALCEGTAVRCEQLIQAMVRSYPLPVLTRFVEQYPPYPNQSLPKLNSLF